MTGFGKKLRLSDWLHTHMISAHGQQWPLGPCPRLHFLFIDTVHLVLVLQMQCKNCGILMQTVGIIFVSFIRDDWEGTQQNLFNWQSLNYLLAYKGKKRRSLFFEGLGEVFYISCSVNARFPTNSVRCLFSTEVVWWLVLSSCCLLSTQSTRKPSLCLSRSLA